MKVGMHEKPSRQTYVKADEMLQYIPQDYALTRYQDGLEGSDFYTLGGVLQGAISFSNN